MKIIKLEFQTRDGEVIKEDDFIINEGDNWFDLEKNLATWLDKHVKSNSNKTSADIIAGEWRSSRSFPNGTHFFIMADNEFGFESGYLFRKKEEK